MPFAFTEYGVLMLASVLNSPMAIQVNIQIVRIFTKLRVLLVKVDGLQEKIEKLEAQYSNHDEKVRLLFEYVAQLIEIKENEENFKDRRQIGFNQD